MSLDDATVRKIAHLARISVAEKDIAPLAKELSGIMDWIEQLQEVDTSAVEPMTGGADMMLNWRKDAVTDGGHTDKVLANAPESHEGFFGVPKVIE
ncbi:MAG: Asp-tRNA(Asn)/Glu-tRNA(Gln) amidotransferase subunit GatC [Rhodospirillaceae bacterium]|jgi:aspartyl-tRNA(Asn)/glutamyl-tRNA(Gln) amidotransferase subunit C|nr:Asp-tRNA(Asn)/Glu-tRNA(Gln) amidotransferase subunit GatC [Rhodospirillaceae bacterium]